MSVKLPDRPPVRPLIIVHGLAHVQRAVRTGRAFRLLSAPGAGGTLGVPWWRALAAAAGQSDDILDCGHSAAAALEALRAGQRTLVLAGPFAATIREIAATCGATVLADAPPALDLGQRGAAHRLLAWLDAD